MYTVYRLLFLVIAWLLIQITTPVRGAWAVALAIVVSAVFSILLLGRQRDAMSGSMFGFFRRINERIDAAAAKEDYDDLVIVKEDYDDPVIVKEDYDYPVIVEEVELPSDRTVAQAKAQAESDSVEQQENPGRLEDRN
jgi:hypothetical protein